MHTYIWLRCWGYVKATGSRFKTKRYYSAKKYHVAVLFFPLFWSTYRKTFHEWEDRSRNAYPNLQVLGYCCGRVGGALPWRPLPAVCPTPPSSPSLAWAPLLCGAPGAPSMTCGTVTLTMLWSGHASGPSPPDRSALNFPFKYLNVANDVFFVFPK